MLSVIVIIHPAEASEQLRNYHLCTCTHRLTLAGISVNTQTHETQLLYLFEGKHTPNTNLCLCLLSRLEAMTSTLSKT